ncbi:hypothetical protein ACVBEG_27275 [Pseudomonas sp. GG8]
MFFSTKSIFFSIRLAPGARDVARGHHSVPALGPVLVYENELEGAVIAYFPDIYRAATALAGHSELVEVLGEAASVAMGDSGAFLPRIEQDAGWMGRTGAKRHRGAPVVVVEALIGLEIVIRVVWALGRLVGAALEHV